VEGLNTRPALQPPGFRFILGFRAPTQDLYLDAQNEREGVNKVEGGREEGEEEGREGGRTRKG
jgi:hypothetical protein